MQATWLPADNYCMREIDGREEHGASLVEVAMLIALVAVVTIGVLVRLGSSSGTKLDQAGQGIHRASSEGAPPSGGTGGGSGGPSGGDGGGGSGAGPVTGPTAPPTTTTVPAATTTIAPPTTTTTPPTTTTSAPTPAAADLGNGRGTRNGSYRWDASADLTVGSDPGRSLRGTATVRVTTTRRSGSTSSSTVEVRLDDDGNAAIETGPYNRTGSSRIEQVTYTIIAIEFDDGGPWNGEQPSIDISKPA